MKAHHLLLAGTLLVSACSILPKTEAPNVYLLPGSPGARPRQVNAVAWSLRIQTPQAGASLDNARIAVVPGDHVITTYQGARWSDPAPVLLRNRLLDIFRNDGRVRELSSDEENLQADFVLGGTLRAFQTEYEAGQPVVVIRYDAWLVRNRGQRIVATRQFELRQPSAGKAVPQVVQAFGQASDQLAADVLGWTLQAANAAPSDVQKLP
jgi:cholesterol transport system auxiliary component